MSWLLDTCALSEYARKILAQEVIAWIDEQDEASLFIRPLPVMVGLLMTTAQCHGLTVVTRNVQDFANYYPQVFNPWAL